MSGLYNLIQNSPYFSIAENSPMPVLWVHPDGRLFHVNNSGCDFFQLPLNILRNKKIQDFDPEFAKLDVSVQFQKLKESKTQKFQSRLYIQNKKALDVDVVINYISAEGYEFICAYLFDITERIKKDHELNIKTMELQSINEHLEMIIEERTEVLNNKIQELEATQKMLRLSEDKFSKAFRTSKDTVVVTRLSDGVYIDINEGFTTSLGYTPDEVIGKSSLELNIWKLDSDRAKLVEGLHKYGMVHNLEADYVAKNGSIIHGLMSASFHEFAGEKVIISVTKDVTRQKELEKELKKLNAELSSKVEREISLRQKQETMLFEQRKFADMGQMINAIAHQWRQPLNALGIMIQDIPDAFETKDINLQYLREYEKTAFSLVTYMSDTIDQFRNFFKISKEKQEFDLLGTVSEVFSLINAQLSIKGIKYVISCEKNGRKQIFEEFEDGVCRKTCNTLISGYEGEFKQAMLNLVYNSVDSIEENKTANCELRGLINIDMTTDDAQVSIVVSDNGTGIPDHILPKIFDPFFTTKNEIKGTGIGLYMTKLIFENHFNGKISAGNTDTGAQFIIVLPLSGEDS